MGLCARFGWLPSQAEKEDWAQLNELQQRVINDDAQQEYSAWEQKVKAGWT